MPLYAISLQNIIVQDDDSLDGAELTSEEAAGFTATSLAEGTFPEGIRGVLDGYISCQSNDINEPGEVKLYVNVRLLVEADNRHDAENIAPPKRLLASLTDMMAEGSSLEESWVVCDCEEQVPAARPRM